MVMTDTIQKPGGDSAVIRYHGKNKGIAATVDCVPRYCKAHPKSGAMQAVCETLEKFNFSWCLTYCYYKLLKFWKS
jgi:phosphoribosylformylglycinamidine (FGAM) synthase-like enzyme